MGLEERAEEVREAVLGMRQPLVIFHYDADGISSAGILSEFLRRHGKKAEWRSVPSLNYLDPEEVKDREVIFLDLGSGYSWLEELDSPVIVDHHLPTHSSGIHFNPLFFGVDGGREMSASLACEWVFRQEPELAVVGAVGDSQVPLAGVGREVLERAIVEERKGFSLFGRFSRPLRYSLLSLVPDFPEGLIVAAGARPDQTLEELEEGVRRRLLSLVAVYAAFSGIDPGRLIGTYYEFPEFPHELREAGVFASVLNACGKEGEGLVGLQVARFKYVLPEAEEVLAFHRRKVREALEFGAEHLLDVGRFYLVDGRGRVPRGVIGTVVSALATEEKPVVGLAGARRVKISVRGGKANLGKAVREAAEKAGGAGGGHPQAAGADIPAEGLRTFLEEFWRRV